jgi:hypothetical protein
MSYYTSNRNMLKAEVKVKQVKRITHPNMEKRHNLTSMVDRITVPDPQAQITLQRNGIGDAMYTSRILRDEGEGEARESISDRLSRNSVMEHYSGVQRRMPALPPANYRTG